MTSFPPQSGGKGVTCLFSRVPLPPEPVLSRIVGYLPLFSRKAVNTAVLRTGGLRTGSQGKGLGHLGPRGPKCALSAVYARLCSFCGNRPLPLPCEPVLGWRPASRPVLTLNRHKSVINRPRGRFNAGLQDSSIIAWFRTVWREASNLALWACSQDHCPWCGVTAPRGAVTGCGSS